MTERKNDNQNTPYQFIKSSLENGNQHAHQKNIGDEEEEGHQKWRDPVSGNTRQASRSIAKDDGATVFEMLVPGWK